MNIYVFEVPKKAVYAPRHMFYTPSDAFIKSSGLTIEEAETWVSLYRSAGRDSDYISFNKETGNIVIAKFQEWADEGGLVFSNLFDGYLPDEAAFKAVLGWVRWND